MKKILKFLLLSQSVLLLSACVDNNECQKRLYFIGETYDSDSCTIKAELDKENERFIFNFTNKDEDSGYYYDVYFIGNGYDCIVDNHSTNNHEFKYLYENNEPIVFDENGRLEIYESIKLYTDYSSASSKIKETINSDNFDISFGSKTFIPQRNND